MSRPNPTMCVSGDGWHHDVTVIGRSDHVDLDIDDGFEGHVVGLSADEARELAGHLLRHAWLLKQPLIGPSQDASGHSSYYPEGSADRILREAMERREADPRVVQPPPGVPRGGSGTSRRQTGGAHPVSAEPPRPMPTHGPPTGPGQAKPREVGERVLEGLLPRYRDALRRLRESG